MENKTKDTVSEVIGFDIGHAETAVTRANMGATTQPAVLKVQGQAPMVTAVAETKGTVLVGEDAYRGRNPEGLNVAFKSPRLKDHETRHPTKLFVQRIVEMLIEERKIAGGAESLFVVGCPSGWRGTVRRDYEALLQEAGMQQVRVLAESRAAFLAARDSLDIPLDDLKGSVLIIDIGSSTTDFTAVVHMEEKSVDFGSNELGAGILDKIILERSLNAELRELFEAYPQYQAQCLLFSREVKESYFNSNNTEETPAEIFKRVSEKRIPFDVEIGNSDMDEILATPVGDYLQQPDDELRGFDWPSAFRKELQGAREKTVDNPPKMILLTGGASQMGFVLKCCEEAFPEARVERGEEPQFSIARGLAWAGRQDDKVGRFRKEIERVLESGELQNTIRTASLKKLIEGIVNFLVPELERIILSAFIDWRNGHISTLNGMEAATESRIKQYLESLKGPGARKLGEKVIKDWIDTSVKPVVNDLFTPICEEAGIPDSSLSLSRDFSAHALHVRAIPSSDIEATDSLDNLSLIAAAIGSIIIATLLGGSGAAILMSGPVGWILGLIIGAIVMFVGRAAAMDKARDADIPEFLRWMVTSEEKVRNKLQENRGELRRQLSTALRKNASAFDEMINGIAEKVKDEIEKKAREEEMLIK